MYVSVQPDDKGPILATIFAVRELQQEGPLPINVVFAYEGEQEQSKNASIGFHEAVTSHMNMYVWDGCVRTNRKETGRGQCFS